MITKTRKPAAFYRAGTYKPDESVGYLMKRVQQSLIAQIDQRLAEHGLTHAQWVPLFRLLHDECPTVASLARDLQTDPGAMTRSLDRLEAKGLVQRVRSTVDRRVVDLELTDAGRRLAKVVPPVLAEVLNAHLAGFSEAEWLQLRQLLRRMLDNGEAMATDD
jgi:DNA-binding MarR family transcriptional regulator